jgi:hypothetical protein
MDSNIFIPKKIKVGFQPRSDTFTGKLGYVIYHDGKVWRKEKSWESWRTKEATDVECQKMIDEYNNSSYVKNANKCVTTFEELSDWHKQEKSNDPGIIPKEFENVPLEGFVLNKKAGGYKSGWNHRQTYCRIYDPRGFEFEITIPNLLYILENSNSVKGKGLEGKFIYGWQGTDLILIPEQAPEFEEMVKFTEVQQSKAIPKSELTPGWKYLTRSKTIVTYLGYFEEGKLDYSYGQSFYLPGTKKHWFYTDTPKYTWDDKYRFITQSDYKNLVQKIEIDPEYPNLLDALEKLPHYQSGNLFEFIPVQYSEIHRSDGKTCTFFIDTDRGFFEVHLYNDRHRNHYIQYKWETKEKYNIGRKEYISCSYLYDQLKISQYYLLKTKDKHGKETIIR